MRVLKNISLVFKSADQIPFNDSSRIILMSDCHRGDGSWADNFSKNQSLFYAALSYYYKKNFTYIELGDGDELWENNAFSEIMLIHSDIYQLLSKFLKEGRLYLIFGNHDIIKKDYKLKRSNYRNFDAREKNHLSLFENIKFHEGLVLKHTITQDKILLLHGHQADFLNSTLWKLSRFLVRYIWKPLELFGINDPTSAAKNYDKKALVEKILINWVVKENQLLIAGHTHRPMFPKVGDPPYFNDGCCIHPHSITGIEIVGGYIILVKWKVKTRDDLSMFVGREVLAGPTKLADYFHTGCNRYNTYKNL